MAKAPYFKKFQRKQFNQIKNEIENSVSNSLGAVNLESPSVFASIVNIFAEREALIWQQAEAVYNSAYPDTAEGYSLDGVCALTGVIRESATHSQGVCQLTAVNYTKIPKHSELKVKNTDHLFTSTENTIITNEKCCAIHFQINNENKSSYELVLNDKTFKYIKLEKDKVGDIALGLVSMLKSANVPINATINDDEIILIAKEDSATFSCFVSDGIKIISCTNHVSFQATEKGAIAAPIGSLTEIHTPIAGLISANNQTASKIGNNLESDRNLRTRRKASIKLSGSGTLEAIRANLLNLSGVTAVTIVENSDVKKDKKGLPPHSFEALVTGGDDSDIAGMIWQKKPAGIRTHGKIDVAIEDRSHKTQIIKFSRPSKVFVFAEIVITKTSSFNDDCLPEMQKRLIHQMNQLDVGSNVILKSLFLSIFSEQGIANAVIKLGGSLKESSKPSLNENDIEIQASEIALTDTTKIKITTKAF